MPGSHQMSGLFIHLGVSCPGCPLAGLDLPQGATAPLPFPQKKGCFWRSSVPCPYLWLLLSDISLVFSVSYSQRGKGASDPAVADCSFPLPVTQTRIQRSPVTEILASSLKVALVQVVPVRTYTERWREPQGTHELRRDRNMKVI